MGINILTAAINHFKDCSIKYDEAFLIIHIIIAVYIIS